MTAVAGRSRAGAAARSARLLPLAVAVAALVWGAIDAAGALGGAAALGVAGFACALVLWARSFPEEGRVAAGRTATAALLLVPGALTALLAFASGGYFPDTTALAALALALILIAHCALAERPLAGLGPRALVPGVALALFATWVWLSGAWSGAEGRALIEADRALLYLLAFATFAVVGATPRRIALAIRGLAAAIVLVAALALLSRLAPDVFATGALSRPERLAYPLTYWNALGILCAIGMVLALHLSGSTDEPRPVRVLAAGALPVLGATLLLTFSRGAAGAAVLGLCAYAILGRPRALALALLTSGPLTYVAVRAAYDATLLATEDARSAGAIAQGHQVGSTVLWCVAIAMVLRALLLVVDAGVDRIALPARVRRPVLAGSWALATLAVVAVIVAFDVPGEASQRWDQFVGQSSVGDVERVRDRLGSASNQGRLGHWRAAMEGYRERPLTGTGAGTYGVLWYAHRGGQTFPVVDGHSLYAETLGELGIVGIGLLAVALGVILVGLAPIRRGRARPLYAALLAATLAWTAHAGLDWDWEMPAVTLWVFAIGGLALGRTRTAVAPLAPTSTLILAALVAAAVVAVAIVPARVLASQSHLDRGIRALQHDHCPAAVREARAASAVTDTRHEPYELLALCRSRARDYPGTIAALRAGIDRDPDNWRLHAALGAALAASGENPLSALSVATRLNPAGREEWLDAFDASGPRTLRRRGATYLRTLGYSGR